MTPTVYKVLNIGKGTLYIMAMPYKDHLEDNIAFLKQSEITKVVSLLQIEEASDLGLAEESTLCEAASIAFESIPVPDRSVPNPHTLKRHTIRLLAEMEAGENTVIHCRGGIGRTGIFSCALLIEFGFSAYESIKRVSDARKNPVPDTREQEEFIRAYELM